MSRDANSPRSARAATAALAAILATATIAAGVPAAAEDTPYTIIDGKVDFGTYNGFRRVAQPGRALSSGGRGRRLKSSHSDQLNQ